MLAENPCIIDMIYLDFSKAFDKVDFGILFHKMLTIYPAVSMSCTTVCMRQCGKSLALCSFAVVMELPDSLWMNCKSEFGVIFLWCLPR